MQNSKGPKKVGMLTAGGLAPCLSSCVASLIETYSELFPETEIYCYLNGFRALPIGEKVKVTPEMIRNAPLLHKIGGSPIGNSRVSLDNSEDCYRRKLVPQGENPWHVACDRLVDDGIEVIHPIGGDGTSIGASRLATFSKERHQGYKLAVVGLPKTIDNDIQPIKQSLGAHTAAAQGAAFFANVVGENTASNRMLLVHELMGRNSGYLAAETARMYNQLLEENSEIMGENPKRKIHALYIPELPIDFESEIIRLRRVMDAFDCVNIFISEGAGLDMIKAQIEKSGQNVERDSSGNIMLSKLNAGQWIADNFGKKIGANETLVQKSGYFCRAAAADDFDRDLIKKCCRVAVKEAAKGNSGIVGQNLDNNDKIELIPLEKIKGGKVFDVNQKWFIELRDKIGMTGFDKNEIKKNIFRRSKNISFGNEIFNNETNFATIKMSLFTSSENEEYFLQKILSKSNFNENEMNSLKEILLGFLMSFKFIDSQIKNAGVLGGEEEKRAFNTLQLVAERTISSSMKEIKSVRNICIRLSESKDKLHSNDNEEEFDIFCDPLDGASNIKANVSLGTIFGVYKHRPNTLLQKGSQLALAGYCFYGAAVILVFALPGRVVAFKLNSNNNEFELFKEDIKIPLNGNIYSCNTSYYEEFDEKTKKYFDFCQKEKRKLRYIGTMVADIHRTLIYGGIFCYPGNFKCPKGKLSLMTEANPMAFLIENAGGKATSGQEEIIQIMPQTLTETTPVFIGSKLLVEELLQLFK